MNFEILQEKYKILQRIALGIFKRRGYEIFEIRKFSEGGADILLKMDGVLIPVEFKAEVAYGYNINKGLDQISRYIQENKSPYGYFVTTANKKNVAGASNNVRMLWGNNLYEEHCNRNDVDFIRYTPTKTIRQVKVKSLNDFAHR